ncbi:hypothetical protein ACPCHT_01675 [Nucisporomicrobium flavum]|uniref:hypothetical protein n=1 Tax=Nucisporomicrobium flavum TaxID=2785915 RepID=UPI0018F2DB28|nr:hypothetical protein [Nucisporomicrobium flavum]
MRKTIAKLTAAAALGVVAAGALAVPALAEGPDWADDLLVSVENSSGRVVGQVHLHLVDAPDHYDIAVADKVSDGKIPCVQIFATNGNKPTYCDDNGTSAAKHYQIYYDWYDAAVLLR